jgi:hypothetical protein
MDPKTKAERTITCGVCHCIWPRASMKLMQVENGPPRPVCLQCIREGRQPAQRGIDYQA